ncbi:MAG: HEAT repeat domain-containing protein [Phototrophicaceae bacterium]
MSEADARLEMLIARLDDPAEREGAIAALGTFNDARAVDALARLLLAGDGGDAMAYRTRVQAAEALGATGHPAALSPLLIGLDDEHAAVRAAAAEALGRLGDARAVDPLVGALEDARDTVRAAALDALGRLATADADVPVAPLIDRLADPEDALRQQARDVIAAQGMAAFDALVEALRDPNSTIRGAAADLLGLLGDERIRTPLKDVLLNDSSRWVRSRAKAALDTLPPAETPFPRVRRGDDAPGVAPPRDTINLMRSQQADWSTLLSGRQGTGSTPALDPDDLDVAEIRDLLDQLDLRLINGEISEATYNQLVARWEQRLKELGGTDDAD